MVVILFYGGISQCNIFLPFSFVHTSEVADLSENCNEKYNSKINYVKIRDHKDSGIVQFMNTINFYASLTYEHVVYFFCSFNFSLYYVSLLF